MPKYDVAVTWRVNGVFHQVEAASLKEAIEKVLDGDPPYDCLPKDGEYVDDTFRLDKDATKDLNPNVCSCGRDRKHFVRDDGTEVYGCPRCDND